MAEKTVRMSDKEKYELGTPVRELMDYEALRPQPVEVAPSYGFYFFPKAVSRLLPSSTESSFKVGDLVGKAVRAKLRLNLEESIKN